jgi:hypothetical protein
VDPRAGLDDVKKRKCLTLPELELLPFCRPASRYTNYAIPAELSGSLEIHLRSLLATTSNTYIALMWSVMAFVVHIIRFRVSLRSPSYGPSKLFKFLIRRLGYEFYPSLIPPHAPQPCGNTGSEKRKTLEYLFQF